jgi:hypothetical protein
MLIQEKEYSHIRFGLVKLIFNDVMNASRQCSSNGPKMIFLEFLLQKYLT